MFRSPAGAMSKFYTLGELNIQINSRKSVGGADLTAEQMEELLALRLVIMQRIKSRVVERRSRTVDAEMPLECVVEQRSHTVDVGLPLEPSDELAGLRVRQRADRSQARVLKKVLATEKVTKAATKAAGKAAKAAERAARAAARAAKDEVRAAKVREEAALRRCERWLG